MKKLNIISVIKDGSLLGLKNAVSILGTLILWVLTCWIPYINVGTTIALMSCPLELSKGRVISPTFIFDKKYRNLMGNFFMLTGLKSLVLVPAYVFMIIPGIIIAISYSLGLLIMIDNNINPTESLKLSNDKTMGNKGNIFLINLLLGICLGVLMALFALIPVEILAGILMLVLALIFAAILFSVQAVIYRTLVLEETPEINDNIEM
jgi:hypothetical protein